jgi:hypothetical protein
VAAGISDLPCKVGPENSHVAFAQIVIFVFVRGEKRISRACDLDCGLFLETLDSPLGRLESLSVSTLLTGYHGPSNLAPVQIDILYIFSDSGQAWRTCLRAAS